LGASGQRRGRMDLVKAHKSYVISQNTNNIDKCIRSVLIYLDSLSLRGLIACRFVEIKKKYDKIEEWQGQKEEKIMFKKILLESLNEILKEILPAAWYISIHPEDPALIGFWETKET
jgi:hypothetical protein